MKYDNRERWDEGVADWRRVEIAEMIYNTSLPYCVMPKALRDRFHEVHFPAGEFKSDAGALIERDERIGARQFEALELASEVALKTLFLRWQALNNFVGCKGLYSACTPDLIYAGWKCVRRALEKPGIGCRHGFQIRLVNDTQLRRDQEAYQRVCSTPALALVKERYVVERPDKQHYRLLNGDISAHQPFVNDVSGIFARLWKCSRPLSPSDREVYTVKIGEAASDYANGKWRPGRISAGGYTA
jgi:hypothetical protein